MFPEEVVLATATVSACDVTGLSSEEVVLATGSECDVAGLSSEEVVLATGSGCEGATAVGGFSCNWAEDFG